MNEKDDLERQISELLIDGEMMNQEDLQEQGRRMIPPKYEIRIQTTLDPIVEETRKYREIAEEIDDRYDSYLEKADRNNTKMN
ncbi:hypothetical protein [Paenibacillus crassostreae]|uniref:Uncharacterized protein n=1 Tax=Paenibacillus crassostreae TaxID=1763538 RepID=A0A167CTI9_9BACL|nr:hypothetical protein [Paenibacillus crassostreae]AOZ93541.1 hypothetical protein LPB68_15985 [Paenibacillus crassostreae]OAB73561.1 hypothetical protein PNBC_13715 [Paenibacillus crassostreae]